MSPARLLPTAGHRETYTLNSVYEQVTDTFFKAGNLHHCVRQKYCSGNK